jgi:hypothetical protein
MATEVETERCASQPPNVASLSSSPTARPSGGTRDAHPAGPPGGVASGARGLCWLNQPTPLRH